MKAEQTLAVRVRCLRIEQVLETGLGIFLFTVCVCVFVCVYPTKKPRRGRVSTQDSFRKSSCRESRPWLLFNVSDTLD